ncbi:MAG TPA: ACP S-malonyltransferase [Candidatus Saccharimonadales bacterium]|nr:ACP S-malonyltransferase [Candidatus Saccharimonadales bacterium]
MPKKGVLDNIKLESLNQPIAIFRENALAILSPGQGVQQPGMGEEIYLASEKAKEVFDIASEVTGLDMSEVCFGNQTSRLEETLVAQPAIAAVTISEYYHLKKLGLRPDLGMGHSMGEVPLMAMVGALSIRDAFRLLQIRAEATYKASEDRPGGMTVVLGLMRDQVKEISAPILSSGRAALANLNSKTQHVMSGDHEQIQRLEEIVRQLKISQRIRVGYKRLPIPGAFHSAYHMEGAARDFYESAQTFSFSDPEFEVMLNNTRYLSELGNDNLPQYLSNQLTEGVDFAGATERVINDGVRNFIEVGPIGPKARYKTLSGLIMSDFAQRVKIVEIRETEGEQTASRDEQQI